VLLFMALATGAAQHPKHTIWVTWSTTSPVTYPPHLQVTASSTSTTLIADSASKDEIEMRIAQAGGQLPTFASSSSDS
jgi:hypothetical protein